MGQYGYRLTFSKHSSGGKFEDHGNTLLLEMVGGEPGQYRHNEAKPFSDILSSKFVGDYFLGNRVPRISK